MGAMQASPSSETACREEEAYGHIAPGLTTTLENFQGALVERSGGGAKEINMSWGQIYIGLLNGL